MKPKGEVNYIAIKQRKPLWISIILILIFFITIQTVITIKCLVEAISLTREKEQLNRAIDMKNSQIADLEENCKDLFIELEELKYVKNKR